MRVRIAQATSTNTSSETNFLDALQDDTRSSSETLVEMNDDGLSPDERRVLDKVGEALARLGRNKRVGLGVKEKQEFVKAWNKSRHSL